MVVQLQSVHLVHCGVEVEWPISILVPNRLGLVLKFGRAISKELTPESSNC